MRFQDYGSENRKELTQGLFAKEYSIENKNNNCCHQTRIPIKILWQLSENMNTSYRLIHWFSVHRLTAAEKSSLKI